jgi:TetR/AcrR family transcriptional repressor of nem operon
MPALASEIARVGGPSRAVFEKNLHGLIELIGQETGPGSAGKNEAIASIALCVGGLLLARAVDDQKLSDRILSACRAAALEESAIAP